MKWIVAEADTMNKWDRRFLRLAEHIALWSHDPSTKVGAVVVDADDKRNISLGYNGFPPGIADDECLNNRALKYRLTIHAEVNAMRNACFPVTNATIYTTKFPCDACAKEIVSARIGRVVAAEPDWACKRWGESARFARDVFEEAGVRISLVGEEVSGTFSALLSLPANPNRQ